MELSVGQVGSREKENPRRAPGVKDRMLLLKSISLPPPLSGTSATLSSRGPREEQRGMQMKMFGFPLERGCLQVGNPSLTNQ